MSTVLADASAAAATATAAAEAAATAAASTTAAAAIASPSALSIYSSAIACGFALGRDGGIMAKAAGSAVALALLRCLPLTCPQRLFWVTVAAAAACVAVSTKQDSPAVQNSISSSAIEDISADAVAQEAAEA